VLPDLAERMRAGGGTGMHTTDTVDVVLVVSGAITLELVDGTAVGLAAGDTVVQLGEPHRWVNHGPDPATIALFMVGADH
jgi:quercetin dioxygenase-like cupin family protein